MPLNSLTIIFYWYNKVWKEGSDPAFQFLFQNNLASQTCVSSILKIIFFPVPHPMSRFWRILLPQDQWNPTSCQDILRFPKPALYFSQISDSKTTLQEPDTSQTAVRGRKPSRPASHLTCGEVFIMITFIAVLAKIGRWVYAPVTVTPQGRGIRHTQDRLTFPPIFMSNLIFYTRGETLMSNTSSSGVNFVLSSHVARFEQRHFP